MNPVTLTIEAGGRTLQMSEAGMAMLFGLPPERIRTSIHRHLALGTLTPSKTSPPAPPSPANEPAGEGGKGGMGHVPRHVSGNVNDSQNVDVTENVYEEKYKSRNVTENVTNGTSGEGRGLGKETPPAPPATFARYLALALQDADSLRCYERLVEAHPPARLDRALHLTLAVPAHRLAKSRAAYFMGVVRTLTKQETT